jgi:hypothetical protein
MNCVYIQCDVANVFIICIIYVCVLFFNNTIDTLSIAASTQFP